MKHEMMKVAALTLAALLAVHPASADELRPHGKVENVPAGANAEHRERARQANRAAAEQAVEALQASNRLDLDIRLIGPTSEKIAGDQ